VRSLDQNCGSDLAFTAEQFGAHGGEAVIITKVLRERYLCTILEPRLASGVNAMIRCKPCRVHCTFQIRTRRSAGELNGSFPKWLKSTQKDSLFAGLRRKNS
jgi:hypothetical protein